MATKTLTKLKRKQSSQTRSWENLTDRRKLRHIENTLDKAIASSIQDDAIESHEDFKTCVENYSQESGKAPITVELCVGGDDDQEIRGYRFYLTSDPGHRTSGKYLIKNLEGITSKDENYFTPSNIAEICGFAETELDDLDDELEDDLLDLDEENEENEEIDDIDDELDDLLNADFNTELDELDDLDQEDEPSISSVRASQTKASAKTSTKTQSKSPPKAQAKTQERAKTNKSATKNVKSREPLDEASRLSATAATNGREVNGVNVVGLAGQLGTLGIAVGQGVLEQLAAEADAKRLQRILKELQRQNDRVDHISSRLQAANPDSSQSQKSEDNQTISEEPTANNPLAVAATKIGSKVDNVGVKLDPKYQSQPFKLDKDATVSEQLDQIEAYLKLLDKRLDRLEKAIGRLEKQMATPQSQADVEPDVEENNVLPNSNSQPPAEVDILKNLEQRQGHQQQVACADALVGFAQVASELFEQSAKDGIAISSNKNLWVETQNKQVAIALENTQGETLFAATQTRGQWAIAQDHLSADEKTGICKLPQSKAEYAHKASAQALIDKFQEQLPQRFNSNGESSFTWTEKGKTKYEFEMLKLPNGTQLLQGFNPNRNDEQVLDAILVPGQPPEILQCSIPQREMEALLNNQQSTRSTPDVDEQDTGKQRQKQTKTKAKKPEMQV